MHPTFNGCGRSPISVIPSNWKTQRASVKKKWIIFYSFFDPAFDDDPKKRRKKIQIKGMNEYTTVEQRRTITAALIQQEIDMLDVLGYNPITGQYMAPPKEEMYDISPRTPFIDALRLALKKCDVVSGTRNDMISIINSLEKASAVLYDNINFTRYENLRISQISRRHIKSLLDYIGKNNPRWSNNRFNKYKAYISMLFKELLEVEACEINPARDIASKKKTRKLRAILSPDEEKRIDDHLKSKHYYFWRFIRLFYDSQARETELMQLKKNDGVRIDQQEFTVIVKKGKETREDIRVISAEMIPLWREVWNEAKPGQFLFSKNLKPGESKIRPDQVGRRWRKYVKDPEDKGGLGINKDLYSLKHLSTDKLAGTYGIQLASSGAGHSNTTTTSNHYAVGEKRRKIEELKNKVVGFGR